MAANNQNDDTYSIWDQAEDPEEWPPEDEFRGAKLVIAAIVLALFGGGGWWLWQTLNPAQKQELVRASVVAADSRPTTGEVKISFEGTPSEAELAPVLELTLAAEDYRRRARGYLAEGDYRAAINDLNIVIRQSPDDGEMHWLLGDAYLRLGESGMARRHLQTALKLGYVEQALLVAMTHVHLLSGEHDRALTLIREWSNGESDETQVEWQVLRGRALHNLDQQVAAAQAFAEALKLDPENMQAKRGLLKTRVNAGVSGVVAAAIHSEESTTLNKAESWVVQAEREMSRGELEKAQTDFETAMELDPDNLYALSGLVRVLLLTGQSEAAWQPVVQLTQGYPSEPESAFARALYARQVGDYQVALDSLAIVFNQEADYAAGVLLLAEVQLAMGSHRKALYNLSRYHQLVPDSVVGRKNLASAFIERGHVARAVELLEPVEDQMHLYPEIASSLATAHAKLGNPIMAAVYESMAEKLNPDRDQAEPPPPD